MCLFENKEDAFLRLLGNVSVISLDGNDLVFSQDGKAVLIFTKDKPLSITDLSGTWTLTSLEGALANTLFTGTLPTVIFDTVESRITGNAGCNRYNAPFTLVGNTLTVKNAIATRRACESMNGESKFLRLMSGVITVELDGNHLIFKKDGIEQLRFVK
jgi:heat shock protein HslJ